jgi:energy-coupling factor transporter transmembrane protein EcfT
MQKDLLAGLDPRSKFVAFLAVQALLFVPAVRPMPARLFAIAAPLLALLPCGGRSWRHWLHTLALAIPFIAFLSFSVLFLPAADRSELPWIILQLVGKSTLVFLSLALFILNEEPRRLIQAMRQGGLPRSAVVIAAISYRFAGQWRLELEGMHRAWAGRNFSAQSKLRKARYLGGALPLFFERLLDAGAHIHDAMVSRGFHGTFPSWQPLVFSRRDAVFLTLVAMTALAIAIP